MINDYSHTDEIKSILKDKADFVQRDGLNYLIPNWKRFAEEDADSQELIYEWLNDLDKRKIIDEILTIIPHSEKIKIELDLKLIDKIVIEKTFEINECVWGNNIEKNNNFDRNKHWYYYRMNQNVFESENGNFTKRK